MSIEIKFLVINIVRLTHVEICRGSKDLVFDSKTTLVVLVSMKKKT